MAFIQKQRTPNKNLIPSYLNCTLRNGEKPETTIVYLLQTVGCKSQSLLKCLKIPEADRSTHFESYPRSPPTFSNYFFLINLKTGGANSPIEIQRRERRSIKAVYGVKFRQACSIASASSRCGGGRGVVDGYSHSLDRPCAFYLTTYSQIT